ncbi:MAG: PKD domain-containing protein [Bacteroidales bacterium]|nr:PKD domain-containing protein [Bacteroidales bacterium]
MRSVKFFLLGFFILLSLKGSFAQTDSTFWFAVPYATPHHVTETGGVIRLTTIDRDAEVTITRPSSGSLIYQGIIPAGETESVVLPPSYVQNNLTNRFWDTRDSSSILIRSKSPSGDMPPEIKAYYEIARVDETDTTVMVSGNNNPDIFSLKGRNALGEEFYVPFQTRWNNQDWNTPDGAYSSFLVVATEDNTTITVNSPYPIARSTLNGGGNYPTNTNISITLDRGESYKLTPQRKSSGSDVISVDADERIRGTHVTSDKPIAVTTGDDSDRKDNAYDFIGDQLVPIDNLDGDQVIGHEYLVMRGQVDGDNGGERFYVLATQDNTTFDVTFEGGTTNSYGPINAGEQQVVNLPVGTEYAHVVADKPSYVFHVSGFGDELGGAVLPTIDGCTGSLDVSFVRSKEGANGDEFYLNLMTHKSGIANFHVETDNGNTTYTLDPNNFTQVPGTDWYVLDQSDDNLFTDSEITPQTVTRVYNDSSVFHLGMINGRETGGGCMYGYFSDYIDAESGVVVVSSGSQITSGCYGDTIQLRATGGVSYQWDPVDYLNDPTIAEPEAIGLPTGLHKYDVTVSNPCYGDTTLTVLIEIYEDVDAYFEISSGIGCGPFDVDVNNKTTGANTYKWDFQDDRNFDYITDSDSSFTHTYRNQTSSDSVYTMRLVAMNDSTICIDEYSRDVRVHPEINAGFDQTDTIGCNPLEVTFTDTSSGNTYSDGYEWDFDDGSSSDSDSSVTHTFVNGRSVDTTYNVQLVTTSPELCRDTANQDIIVRSFVDAAFTIDTVKGCSPLGVDISNNSKGDVTEAYWNFTRSAGGSYSDTTYSKSAAPDPTFTNTGTIETDTIDIELIVTNGNCYDTARRTVYVYPEVTSAFLPGDTASCNPMEVDFRNQSEFTGTSGDTTGLDYTWDFGDGSTSNDYEPSYIFDNINPSDTAYRVGLTVTNPQGCRDTTSSDLTVSPYINADFKVDEGSGCAPHTVTVTNTAKGGITSYEWNFDDGTIRSASKDTLMHTYENTSSTLNTYTLQLVVENEDNCTDTMTREIDVYPSVNADFDPRNPDTVDCHPVSVDFRNKSAYIGTNDTTDLSYSWEFGDGSSSKEYEPSHSFENYASFTVDYPVELAVTAPNTCTDTVVDTVSVRPYVEADFTVARADSCSPFNVRIENHSSGGYYDWFWDDDDLSSPDTTGVSDEFIKTYHNTTGTDNVVNLTLIADNGFGCTDMMKREITIYPEVTADYQPLDTIDCNMFELPFDNRSTYTNSSDYSDLSYTWDFGDGLTSKDRDPEHTYINNGDTTANFFTELIASSPENCTDTIRDDVQVYPFIDADFKIDKNKGCSPLTVEVTNNSEGGISEYYWFWDDDDLDLGSADSNNSSDFSHTYTNISGSPQIRNLTLIVTNGNCYDTLKRQITVYSSIDAQFTQDTIRGCNPLTVDFESQNPTATDYSWEFGDGATSKQQGPIHEFENTSTNDTTFHVSYMPSTDYGCTDTAYQDIHVHSRLRADFVIEDDEACPPFPVTFENSSVGNPSDTYQWTVTNLNNGNTEASESFSDKSSFSHTFENEDPVVKEFEVELLATNDDGCQSVYLDTITVYHDVDADFTMDRVEGCNPLRISFSDSANVPQGTDYSWNFGDGATSALEDPEHTFFNYDRAQDTNYTIGLEVISPYECRDDTSKTITVYHQPKARFDIDTTSSCPPLEATMEDQSVGHDLWQWRFGDGNTNSSDAVVSHSYPNTTNDVKPYDLELHVETSEGCRDSTSLVLNVYPEVVADFDIEEAEDCAPLVTGFINNSENSDYYSWDFGDGATSSQDEPIHKFVNTTDHDTIYDIQLISSSAYECVDSITKSATVYAQPNAEFTITDGSGLQKWPESEVFMLNKSNQGPWNYTWDFDDGETSDQRDPNFHDYAHWGEYDIGLEITSQTSSCWDTTSKSIEILAPRVYADFSINIGPEPHCEPLPVEFTADEAPFNESYDYEWNFGDGHYGKGRIVNHEYDSAGTYYVKMTASGESGEASAYDTVRVYKRPEIDFDVDPKVVMLPDQKMNCYNFTEYAETYKWQFGDGSTSTEEKPVYQYEELGEYTVTLTAWSDHGCASTDSLPNVVEVRGKGQIEFPNAFTPSESGPSDGYYDPEATNNEIFHPVYEGVEEYTLEIFNKWGERIFISRDVDKGWDGYYNGEIMQQDVYIWKAEGQFYNGQSFEKMGDVTLIRNFSNGEED